ncbi:MAG: hypothetical protein GC188_10680 [Alphaproteobacteria bacterium]|nr:hypothetical protein [Alphaproteobacteria bacterium]
MTQAELKNALLVERRAAYGRLRGGAPILLAGATYWLVLTIAGYLTTGEIWYYIALFGSGLIFPFAIMYARLLKNSFMTDRTAVTSVIAPAMIAMLLFWPMAIAALWEAPEVFPLILAIGLSLHFPVIGWSYGRTFLLTAHAVVRALVVFAIWALFPEERLTLIPLVVTLAYLVTAMIIWIDSGRFQSGPSKNR